MKPNIRLKMTNSELHEALPFAKYNPPLDLMGRVGLWMAIVSAFAFWYIIGTLILG